MDERTITIRDSRAPRAPEALRTPQSAQAVPAHREPWTGHRSRVYGDPGAFWHAQRSGCHAEERTRAGHGGKRP
jgi:hypothetical protein